MFAYILFPIVLLVGALYLLLRKKPRNKNEMATSSLTTTPQTTMAPPLANPTGSSGYVFVELLEKYTLTDIKNLEAIALQNENLDKGRSATDPLFGTGRCATALASLCFSTIEQVGLILRTDLNRTTISKALKGEGRTNAESFFSFFASHGLQAVSRAEIDAVYNLFRNKITHNLFPRYSLGVSIDSGNSPNQLVTSISGNYNLSVNFLSGYIKQAIPLLKKPSWQI